MNIGLERLIEGIIATMRADVLPHVGNAYARGQALGVIDVLSSIIPRVEWARGPLMEEVSGKIATLEKVGTLIPDIKPAAPGKDILTLSAKELEDERDRLDREIVAVMTQAASQNSDSAAEALRILKTHMHDELQRDMKLTRKPLFAEISAGGDKPAS